LHNAIGIIFGNTSSNVLEGLAQDRPIAAVPFGGRYRLLDFALSSMVNSGIRTVGLVTPQHYRPMLDHLGAGKDWFLDRKSGGLFILPGAIHGLLGDNSRFRIKDIQLNIEFLEKDIVDNVVISTSDQVFNVNYRNALDCHEHNDADITLIYKQTDNLLEARGRIKLQFDKDKKLHQILKEVEPKEADSHWQYFIDILIIRRKLLLEFIKGYKSIDTMELIDAISDNLKILKVRGYPFNGYVGRIQSIQDYFHRNMELLNSDIRNSLFTNEHPIHTKIRDNPPTKFGELAKVQNSMISSGCSIDGEVENSILSRGVVIQPGCKIKNCIIMSKCIIGQHSQLENVILDKFVEVYEGNTLKGKEMNPLVVYKRAIV
jgi:glucose-1-phosphate adenylyltransferase